MGYKKPEKEYDVSLIKKNDRGEYIGVRQIDDEGTVDIRLYFTSDSGETLPTKKGVRINGDISLEVMSKVIECIEPYDLLELVEKANERLSDLGYLDEDELSSDAAEEGAE